MVTGKKGKQLAGKNVKAYDHVFDQLRGLVWQVGMFKVAIKGHAVEKEEDADPKAEEIYQVGQKEVEKNFALISEKMNALLDALRNVEDDARERNANLVKERHKSKE